MRRASPFEWTPACQQAFDDLKKYLSSPPFLSVPQDSEVLYLYLAVAPCAVSAVLVRQVNEYKNPVSYSSRVLHDAETRYSILEKCAFALVTAARRLKAYFQAHPIVVLTDQPIRQVLLKPDLSGRLAKWAIELGEFGIEFPHRKAIKSRLRP